ncbi:hypothetical protein CH276_18855 [Rhodococcus sp. 06-470-2]|uniref:NUMOD4 motif-containing HNH endonuclease n=1 Tax=unclassified Rhodococcus (in: high G+C Gram-positive bacteria) TaxID=192944 RepID=UPI000B9B0273|nr:hypothetical protein CH276_18855 [Rhodococcus sp. 06-470-2]OZE56971.1 hypothetical protein CH265_24600 [Rhodococcus sp. 05-2221-1B]
MSAAESWRPVRGYEGVYEVSDLGRVRSVARTTQRGSHALRLQGAVLNPNLGTDDKYRVNLSRNGFVRQVRVHRLVLEAFVGPCPVGLEGCHNNGIGKDNRLTNLRWDTPSENQLDKVRHGTHHYSKRDHCSYGHEYTPDNVYSGGKSRQCKTCARRRARESKKRAARV